MLVYVIAPAPDPASPRLPAFLAWQLDVPEGASIDDAVAKFAAERLPLGSLLYVAAQVSSYTLTSAILPTGTDDPPADAPTS